MAKVFISYKYGDDQVSQNLDRKYWAEETDEITGIIKKETKATGRAYVNFLEEQIGKENILKSEKQNESLKGKSEEQIWEILKPKVHDSTVTLIIITQGMKDLNEVESEQWIPNEIRYSLWEVDRGEKTSTTNALLGVIIPNRDNNYDYIYEKSNCQCCGHIKMLNKQNNQYLFNILKGNIFNRKNDSGSHCNGCGSTIFTGDHSYLYLVTFNDFIGRSQEHIENSLRIKGNWNQYNIEKSM